MANRTDKGAHTVKGTNPQYLVEKIIRTRIYESRYWKEECFALSADLVAKKAIELRFVGGIYSGNIKPTPFLCLTLKLLQIQPEKDIIIEFIRQEDFKYVRALGAMYLRLTAPSIEIYKYLEPLYNDYRKLRWMDTTGNFQITYMDEFIDQLLRKERVCDIQVPRLQKREFLEDQQELGPRVSALEEDLDAVSSSSEGSVKNTKKSKNVHRKSRSKSPPDRERDRRRSRSRDREPRRKSPDRSEFRRDRGAGSSKGGGSREIGAGSSKSGGSRESDRKRQREDSYEREIREANELRAKLGLNPLRQ